MSIRFEHPVLRKLREETDIDVVGEIAKVARKTYCSLYSNNPGWIFVKNNFTLPIVKRMSDRICDDYNPPPPPPPPPFIGGQCPVEYEVLLEATATFNGQPRADASARLVLYGPIESIQVIRPLPFNDPRIIGFYAVGKDANGDRYETVSPIGGVGWQANLSSIEINRLDELPDSCGNLTPSPFPELPPPSDADSNITVTITNNNGDSFDYNVEIQRGGDGYFYFPTQFNISGVSATLDIGGVTINNGRGDGDGDGDGDGEPPPEVLEEEEEEKEEPVEPEVKVVNAGTKRNGHIRSAPGILRLTIEMISAPENDDVTSGQGSPDVRYWGWFEWQRGDANYTRQFLHFDTSYFEAPDNATGYAAFYKEGYSGNIIETILVEPAS